MQRLLVIAGLMLCCNSLRAQQDEPNPIPLWPGDAAAPSQASKEYVFVDPPKAQLVLYYPENLGKPGFDKNPGKPKLERVELRSKVHGSLNGSVRAAGGTFIYSYRLTNGDTATQAIQRVEFGSPTPPEGEVLAGPQGWSTSIEAARTDPMSVSSLGVPMATRLRWQTASASVAPGSEAAGFQITSKLQPGLVLALVGGPPPTLRADLPRAVRQQAAPALVPEQSLVGVYCIGPRYTSDTTKVRKAVDFRDNFIRMTRVGALDPRSPATAEAMRALDAYLQAAPTQSDAASENSGPPLVLTATPQPGLESQVIEALKVSMQ